MDIPISERFLLLEAIILTEHLFFQQFYFQDPAKKYNEYFWSNQKFLINLFSGLHKIELAETV